MGWIVAAAVLFPALAVLSLQGYRFRKNRIIAWKQFRYFSHQNSFDYAVFDLRDGRSYRRGHLPQAVHFPLEEVNYLPLEDMFLHIFLYGDREKESRQAYTYLSRNGYFNVYDLGTVHRWTGPMERGEGIHIEHFARKIKKQRKKQEQL